MICRRCRADNPEASRYCSTCGALLTASLARPKRSAPWPVLALIVAAILLAAYLLFLRPGGAPRPAGPDAPAATDAGDPASGAPARGAGGRPVSASAAASASSRPLAAARIALDMAVPGAPSSLETSLFDGTWAALPLWAFLGPNVPRLEGPGPAGLAPAGVRWNGEDPIVLCRFELGSGPAGPELAPYEPGAALEWLPLIGERTALLVEPGSLDRAGSFAAFDLFPAIEAPGALVQGGRIVGWTFGAGVSGGYLWSPADGAGPRASLSPSELASVARRGAREAALLQALSFPDGTSEETRLEALASALRLPARLKDRDLPDFLEPASVAALMSSLTAALTREGRSEAAARALDPDLLDAAGDLALVEAAAAAYNEARGFDAVHRLLDDLRRRPSFGSGGTSAGSLDELEVGLAKSSLHRVLDERGPGGLDIYDRAARLAPADPELRLLGAEVAALEADWALAEELLRGGEPYPDALANQARSLGRVVEEGRRDEDSITIRFDPRSKLIPVEAFLNKAYRQKFFIDTGATMTIIPLAAAAGLDLRIDDSTPVVGLQGVAGSDMAYQVGLDSIEIDGLTVQNIRVLVYDLGAEGNAGLLGNDFL